MDYIGAHINKQKTLLNTMKIITSNNGNTLQFFASNPRSIQPTNLENYKKEAVKILEYCEENNFKLVIHSPYTINLAREFKNGTRECELKDCYWIDLLLKELMLSDMLNAVGSIVHVGKFTKLTPEEGLGNMRKALKFIIHNMKTLDFKSKLILETPVGAGTELLNNIVDFLDFYNSFSKDERKYLKICIDTAHIWSNGYELEEAFELIFKKNTKDIAAIHYNNSEKHKGSKVDVHAPIFEGKIPLDDLENVIKILKKNKAEPLIILECPSNNLQNEIDWIKDI